MDATPNAYSKSNDDDDDDGKDDEKDSLFNPNPQSMISNYDVALKYYQEFVLKEKAKKRQALLSAAIQGPTGAAVDTSNIRMISLPPKPHLLTTRRRKKEMQRQLKSLPGFTSWFMFVLTSVQIIVMVIMMSWTFKISHMAPMGISNYWTPCTGANCPAGFDGSFNTSASTVTQVNPFYGPSPIVLLQWGARLAPCMRQDTYILSQFAAVRAMECGIPPNFCETGQWVDGVGISCCHLVAANRFGMTDKPTCDTYGGTWMNDGSNQSTLCAVSANIVLRPCCLG